MKAFVEELIALMAKHGVEIHDEDIVNEYGDLVAIKHWFKGSGLPMSVEEVRIRAEHARHGVNYDEDGGPAVWPTHKADTPAPGPWLRGCGD